MELIGTVKVIKDLEAFESGFKKREIVLQTDEQYPQPIAIEFRGEKTDLLNDLKVWDKIKVGININGREWTAPDGAVKYFNTIVGWRIEKI